MARTTVGLITDLAWSEGIGRYGLQLRRLLGAEYDVELVHLNYQERCVEVTRDGQTRRTGRYPKLPIVDCKPVFWYQVRRVIPHYDIPHFISQNLSFLVPADGRAVVTCHDIAPLFVPGSRLAKFGRRWLYSGLGRAGSVIADSESTARDVERVFGRPRSETRVIPLGVDCDRFRPMDRSEARGRLGLPAEKRIVLCIGIDKWRKNTAGILHAFAKSASSEFDLMLVRIGQLAPESERLAAELGISARILSIPGPCSDEDLCRYYCAADLLLFPSWYEGFGLPPLEAMACGTPVIASDRTSLPEIVGETGLLVDPGNHTAMAEQVLRVLRDAELASRLSRLGLERARFFDWQFTATATAREYERFLAAGPKA